ncbi:hypothetical protein [Campylobacter canadensis]|uniref:ATP synthase YMF19-like N-terminal domain-containing protein n=1 Tax=Campylobacter canadensis TaxID=449520 RepID=A0ABS7WSI8_9BACT|nr:hypothetical protein [Campylobacter canadensis]MBZ7987730.1 hypothetical protein [Campylobacter canadensis]MBZ7994137.1 hypothetical protein [Campylobacter canadensis]MBZ7995860.1 hypothetical protein [Campylobacter canadensis]MBZ7997497.1 hypothetical protein [Campylobacter canadensis]MBZ7999468.1 hypothetical protein [Campylobacter canadensis]
MNKDNSLNNYSFTKLILWVCLILFSAFILIALMIIPSTNNIKKTKKNNAILEQKTLQLQQQQDKLSNDLNTLLSNNKMYFDKFENKFNEEDFIRFSKEFFDEVSIEKIENEKQEYLNYNLNVSSKITSPTVFYDFILELKNYKNVIKLDFPINMYEKDGKINAIFNLKIYSNNKMEVE